MAGAKTTHSWRELLRAACETPQKKQAIAEQVGFVSERTLDRWIRGQSNPQKIEKIRLLSQAVPGEAMQAALQEAFPEAFPLPTHAAMIEPITIPFEFCWRVIDAYAHVPPSSKRWTIFHLVSNQILPQLDSERAGLLMIYARHAPSISAVVFEESAGNVHWTTRQIGEKTCLDPWLVQCLAESHPFFVQSCALSHIHPPSCIVKQDLIQSIGFFPIYCSGVTVGGMLLCSAQEDFFTPVRQTLIEKYSCLLSLAFCVS